VSSVSSVNPGVADVLQALSSVNSPILNSQSTIKALQSAPVADIVQLSAEATQLQGMDTLFGLNSASTSTSTMTSLLQALEDIGTTSTGSSSTSSTLANLSPADQAASAEAAIQSQLTQGLFGTGTANLTGTLFSTLG
jgi:hypothetical protein